MAADAMIVMGLRSATQWDSLAHVGYDGFFYNGMPTAAVNSFACATRNLVSTGKISNAARRRRNPRRLS